MTLFHAEKYDPVADVILEHYGDPNKYSLLKDMGKIGVTIGSHTGPNVIAFAYSKKYTCYDKKFYCTPKEPTKRFLFYYLFFRLYDIIITVF